MVTTRDKLDRVGDHLTRHERGAHALDAHRDAIRDRDGVELHRRSTGRADALLHPLRQLALVEVAGHRLNPFRSDTDERLCQILIREADGLQHRARGRTIRAVRDRRANALGRVAWSFVRVLVVCHSRPVYVSEATRSSIRPAGPGASTRYRSPGRDGRPFGPDGQARGGRRTPSLPTRNRRRSRGAGARSPGWRHRSQAG